MRFEVRDQEAILQTLMREERHGVIRSYQCLLLFSARRIARPLEDWRQSTLTLHDFESLDRLDEDLDVRRAFVQVFSLALGGILGLRRGSAAIDICCSEPFSGLPDRRVISWLLLRASSTATVLRRGCLRRGCYDAFA